MKKQDYQCSIHTKTKPFEVFMKINKVSEWWAKNFEGSSTNRDDIFTVRFTNGDWYTCKVAEIIPEQMIVWDVIDSNQTWHENNDEWNGTKIVWEINPEKDGLKITMTHQGLVPDFECYEQCNKGWDYLIQKSLKQLLDEDNGLPV